MWGGFRKSLSENIVSEVRWRIVHRVRFVTVLLGGVKKLRLIVVQCVVSVKLLSIVFLECSSVKKAWGGW